MNIKQAKINMKLIRLLTEAIDLLSDIDEETEELFYTADYVIDRYLADITNYSENWKKED